MNPTVIATFGDGRTGWRRAARRISREAQKLEIFEEVHNFNFKDLSLIDPEISNLIKEIRKRTGNRGYGYWVWKTAILFWLDHSYPDKQICYVDAGSHLDTSSIFRQEWRNLFQLSSEKNGLAWALPGHFESEWTKKEVLNVLDPEGEYLNSIQIQSGFICLPPSEERKKFCGEFRNFAKSRSGFLFTDEIEISQNLHFIENRHDQSVFSLLWKKYGFNYLEDATDPRSLGKFPLIALRNNTGLNGKHSPKILMFARYVDLIFDGLFNRH